MCFESSGLRDNGAKVQLRTTTDVRRPIMVSDTEDEGACYRRNWLYRQTNRIQSPEGGL